MGEISHNDVKYYVTSKSFQGKFYHFEVIKIVVTRKFNPLLFSNKQQNIKKFRYDCKLVDRNCPEYGMCPVYGELTLSVFNLEYELNQGYGHMYIHQLSNNGKSPLQTYGIVC